MPMQKPPSPLDAALLADMESKGIDVSLALSILEDYNAGMYDGVKAVEATGVPRVDGTTVIAIGPEFSYTLSASTAKSRLAALGLDIPETARKRGENIEFPRPALVEIGERLFPRTAYGVLNGGSATSYADKKKNLAFGAQALAALAPVFDSLADRCKDKPKGLTPAYIDPDGQAGASFLALKARARLLAAIRYVERYGDPGRAILPLFQMSSVGNDAELAKAYREYESHPFLAGLSAKLRLMTSASVSGTASGSTAGAKKADIHETVRFPISREQAACAFATGVQPMICAYTHSSEGRPKRVFDRANGEANSAIALPGGHGQCFRVLASVLKSLHALGLRYAYLGNVDNIGFLPDPVEIALLALSGEPAAFDFSMRTAVDVKGGILVEMAGGRRTVADIGPAISFEAVRKLEDEGASILFNCATGLFDLDWLVPRIDDLARRLPVRFTDQDKDAGRYAQAEQVTWEITSLLPSFLAFAVDKYDRFIAAKLLVETLITSGIGKGDPRLPPEISAAQELLYEGLARKLSGPYGLELREGKWRALEEKKT